MPVPSIILDGSQVYGTSLLVINGITYKANNINIDRGETVATDRNEQGKPQRERVTVDVPTMTAELQASQGVAYPQFGATFTVTLDSNYGAETWKVMPTNFVATNGEGDIRVIPLRARLVLNPGQYSTVS